MKKLTVLVVVILIAGLLAGCAILPGSRLWRIEVEPSSVSLTYVDPQQLEVTAFYDDGDSADVTPECDYVSENPEIVIVGDEGLIEAVSPDTGTHFVTIFVTYTQRNFWTGNITRYGEVEVWLHK